MSFDAHLKLLADASLSAEAAEEALAAGEAGSAEESIDGADAALAELRERWSAMTPPERAVVGRAARPVRERLDGLRARLPKRRALSEGAPVADPEQDLDPEAAA